MTCCRRPTPPSKRWRGARFAAPPLPAVDCAASRSFVGGASAPMLSGQCPERPIAIGAKSVGAEAPPTEAPPTKKCRGIFCSGCRKRGPWIVDRA
ncbi:DUF6053 domain-containing protein [Lysobacter sp. 2RAB21]